VKPVLVVEQERSLEGLGLLGDRLDASGLPYRRLKLWESSFDGLRADEFAGIVPMGGNSHAWEEECRPFLRAERLFLGEAVERGVPVLGICLGAQVLARALGAEVGPGADPEIGWREIEPTDDAAGDPLFGHLTAPEGVYQWHHDGFELPEGARRLASSPLYPNQAFRVDGADAWGIQFHPEVDPEIFEVWIGRHPDEVREAGVDVAELREKVYTGAARSWPFRAGLFDNFLGLVRERTGAAAR
jgi:GMP synthase (glutamine-hydrolysing)